ncbi:LOW QUALITY PROTEIN: leucine-rich repeat-containing protein 69-like [Uloborus diversus]|uniref:LOW QUALITY PROTEIN: leucine-rich repeat-containing protein 69-like n=1 Tax=Uloborus diversus TaxID=327109 RepID=UPI00240A15B9|nr:LOW QUALITY PROTEIN: leucine-rich repeat-containing protein 69-like [Uloborus diversus]
MVNIFHCYEFLLLRKLDNDLDFWNKIKGSVLKENDYSFKTVPPELWFVAVTISETRDRFPSFLRKTVLKNPYYLPSRADCILSRYLHYHDFVEMHLDSIFKYGENCILPKELFRCPNLRVLSLKCNFLEQLPPDIGKLQKLEYLALTNNKLQNSALPYSLSFCSSLRILMLDNNWLDALPGFLLVMPNLSKVHRHGNHNYFKATFMWYHTDVNERILPIPGCSPCTRELQTLKMLSATAIIANKINFFAGSMVPPVLVDYLCGIYFNFNLCYKCCSANLKSKSGYKVYTFKNPYLGNHCVPFQHWACSIKCAEDIEVPAREEQILASMEQDRKYLQHVQEALDSTMYQDKSGIINLNCCIL